jgi:hypothetical protein
MVSISARMVVLLGDYVIGCDAARNAPFADCRRPKRASFTDQVGVAAAAHAR